MYLKEYSIKIMISCLKSLLLIYASTLLYGCGVTRSSSKYNFFDGYYYSKLNGNRSKKYYVASSGDSIKVYPADIAKQNADTIKSITVLFPPNKKPLNFQQYKFRALGLDLTVISIVVKYRPAVKNFPAQLNNTLNGAIYAGYRTDNYFLKYENTPLHVANRKITHHGYSIGGFAGLGPYTLMNMLHLTVLIMNTMVLLLHPVLPLSSGLIKLISVWCSGSIF